MNELVQPDRGILLERMEEAPEMRLSRRYLFKPESLEKEVERAMKFDRATRDQRGAAARSFFLENDRIFRQRFIEVLQSL